MGKIIKGLLYLLGSLLTLIIILAIAIPLFVDPNDYRDEIGAMVKKETGRNLNIEGGIQLSLFPWIGIELGEMSLSNAAGFGDSPFARVQKAEVKIKLIPLLRRQVVMDTIILHGMTLNLAKNSEGISNWEDLTESESFADKGSKVQISPGTSKTTPKDTKATKGASPSKSLAALAIGGLEIRDANIRWHDQSQQQKIEIDHLNLATGAITLNSEFPLEVSFNTIANPGADTPQIVGEISLKAIVGLNLDRKHYYLHRLQLTSAIKSALLPNGQLNSEIGGNLSADLNQQMVNTEGLTIKVLGSEVTLDSDITHIDQNPEVSASVHIKVAHAAPLIELLGDALPKTITREILETTTFNTQFALNTGPQKISLEKFRLKFDQSTIEGSASVVGFDNPAIGYDIAINSINIDRYLPTGKVDQTPIVTADKESSAVDTGDEPLPIPVELLRTLDIDGTLSLGALQVMGLHASNMVAALKVKGGKLTLHPLSAELYQGQFDGSVEVDVRKELPTYRVEEKLSGFQSAPLLQDLLGKDYVSGKALVTASMTTRGDRISQLKEGLNGRATLKFEDGAINGVDIPQLIRNANASYKKQPTERPSENPKTSFGSLSASVKIKNGLVSNDDLSVKAPLLRIEGHGQANLVTEKIDYRARALINKELEDKDDLSLSELKGLTIPVAIKGSLSAPKISIELEQLLNERLKAKTDALKEKSRQKIQQKIESEKAKISAAKTKAKQKANKKKEALKNRLKDKFKLKF